jgi:hypothetical protein
VILLFHILGEGMFHLALLCWLFLFIFRFGYRVIANLMRRVIMEMRLRMEKLTSLPPRLLRTNILEELLAIAMSLMIKSVW